MLILEDEPVLRIFAIDMVEDAGFEAVEAMDIGDGLRILAERPDIRIVYMDLDMPRGVRGIEIAGRIREQWPLTGIILTAAYHTREGIDLPERAEFYPKPIHRGQVIAAMRRMGGRMQTEVAD